MARGFVLATQQISNRRWTRTDAGYMSKKQCLKPSWPSGELPSPQSSVLVFCKEVLKREELVQQPLTHQAGREKQVKQMFFSMKPRIEVGGRGKPTSGTLMEKILKQGPVVTQNGFNSYIVGFTKMLSNKICHCLLLFSPAAHHMPWEVFLIYMVINNRSLKL